MVYKKQLIKKTTLVIFLASFVFLLSFILGYQLFYYKKIFPYTFVLNFDISGKNKVEATNYLVNQFRELELNNAYISFQDQTLKIPLGKIKAKFKFNLSVDRAYKIGRKQNLLIGLKEQIVSRYKANELLADVDFDQSLLKEVLATVSAQITIPVIEPDLIIFAQESEKKVIIQPGQNGQALNWEKSRQDIISSLARLEEPHINLSTTAISPSYKQKELQEAQKKASLYLDKKIILNHEDKSWELNDKKLISFVKLSAMLNQEKIASFTASLSQSVDRPAQNALFEYDGVNVTQFKPAQTGIKLDQEKSQDLIKKSMTELENPDKNEVELSLPVFLSQPKTSTADSNSLGITGQVAKGESWFAHSISSRIFNIGLASSKLHGLLIPPGEQFSFNQTVGDISLQSGYKEAYIIKEGRTILGDGGGVCQVSTTLFRAALNAGLEIVKRSPHAYRVSYYEQNYQPGFDATVFEPNPDLVFKNNSQFHILIQRIFNSSNNYLAFVFYGHPDGRRVEISKSRTWDQNPPPPDLYQDDPSLTAGVVKQIDWAAWGAKTAFDYKVSLNGQILQKKTFYSNYRPWQAIYLRGTKTD